MLDNLLTFPGLPWVSDILAVAIVIAFEITFFVLLVACLKYNVPGQTKASRFVGLFAGVLLGVFFARGYTTTLSHYWPLNDAMVSAALGGFILLNAAIATAMYSTTPTGGRHAP